MAEFPDRTEQMTAEQFLLSQVEHNSPEYWAILQDNAGEPDPLYEPHDFKPDWSMDAAKARFAAREAAHQAVKAFDLAPNIQNTTAAIEALSEYEQHLKEENDGPTV